MSKTYQLKSITDLLLIPIDRREACMHELLYALALVDLTTLDASQLLPDTSWSWTDDGDPSASISANGEEVLSLKITKTP